MYNFKAINMSIPDKIFNETCFLAVSDAKFKLKNTSYIPAELKSGIFCCNGTGNENLAVLISLKNSMYDKKYLEGIDFTINVYMDN